jgi:predicted RNase H-like HicB family nuclease
LAKERLGCNIHKYQIIIHWSNEDEAYVAKVPELPGCMAHGNTYESAAANANEAIQLWIDTAKEFGDQIRSRKGPRLMLA